MTYPGGRAPENPILTPAMVAPSRPELRVVGVFNPAVIQGEQTRLLVRVAEAARDVSPDEVAAPFYDAELGRLAIRRWRRDTPGLDTTDPRVIRHDGETFLTSISHLRWARSSDGVSFDVDPEPALAPGTALEAFGVEDPRATLVDGHWWVNYSAVSPWGIATAVARVGDGGRLERRGILFAPPNRDVTIFSGRIGGRYRALHRPMPAEPGRHAIWLASSPDLVAWGDHRLLAAPRDGFWDDLKVGAGAPPFRVDLEDRAAQLSEAPSGTSAWLAVYHGVGAAPLRYSLGALLLDENDPSRVLGRSREPILAPEAPYERQGFFGDVVFTCGALLLGDTVRVYYGAADEVTAVADLSLDEILSGLR